MKKISIALLLVVGILFILDGTFSFFIQENRNIKLSNVSKGGLDYDILYHGPCEPLFTIDASYLDSVLGTNSYNFALRHTDFADNFLHLYLYLKQNKAPKQVYLYVTPESFDLRFNSFHSYRFAPYLSDTLVAQVVEEMDPNYYSKTWFPFMRFAYYNSYKTFDALQGVKHYWDKKQDPYFKDGFIAHPDNQYFTRKDGYIAPEHLVYAANYDVSEISDSTLYYELYEKRQTFKWDPIRTKYLVQLFELCKKNQIELILYESPAYSGAINDQPNRDEFLQKTDSIARSFSSKYIVMENLELAKNKSNFVCPLILSIQGTAPFLKAFSDTVKTNLN